LQERWLERYNDQVGGLKIVASREYRFPPKCGERINRAVAEVELSSMAQALPKASIRGDGRLRLRGIEGTISQPSSSTGLWRDGGAWAPLRARRTIPASSSETEHSSRVVALSKAASSLGEEGSSNTLATSADVSITIHRSPFALGGKAKFIVSEDFVITSGVSDRQGGDFLLDCIHLFHIDRAGGPAKLCFKKTNYCIGKSDTHPLAYLCSESMSCGIPGVYTGRSHDCERGTQECVRHNERCATAER
jgi:hypothetical protein